MVPACRAGTGTKYQKTKTDFIVMLGDRHISYSLISAVRDGNLSEVRQIIGSFDLSYSLAWAEGYVLLRDAVENNHTEISKLLLTNGSKVNSKSTKPTDTPLHFAAINGDLEIVEMLLDRGAKVNAKNKYDQTPLHNAVESNQMAIIELLLNQGADVNAETITNDTPMHLALEKCSENIIKFLLSRRANVDGKGFHIAVRKGYSQIIEAFIKYRVDVIFTFWDGYTPLHVATKKGNKKIIELLLSSGALVNAKGKDGATPLHFAIQSGHEQIVELLLENGASIDAKGLNIAVKKGCFQIIKDILNYRTDITSTFCDGYTPLYVAAEKGSKKTIELLLGSGALVNAKGEDGVTPLHLAVQNGHEQVVELLLENGANVDAQDKEDKTILNLAVEKGNRVIIECILKHSPDVNNKSNRNVLNNAVYGYKKEYETVIESLLEYGFTVNSEDVNNSKFVLAAVEKGYLKIVEKLLEYGTDVNMLCKSTYGEGCMPLHAATKNKLEAMTKLLINFGADVNAPDKYGNTPIFYAIANADLNIFNLLLTNKANIRDNPELLNTAVRKECKQIVETLLKYDVDVNARDKNGMTPLLLTCSESTSHHDHMNSDVKVEIVKMLLSRGADVNARTKTGRTTIEAATLKGYANVVEALLEYNADVDSIVKNYGPLLHIAARESYVEVLEVLLKFGATIDSKDSLHRTALHVACLKGHQEIVIALLDHGSDVNITSYNHYTPLDFAIQGSKAFYENIYSQPGYDSDDDNYYDRYDRGISPWEEIEEILEYHSIKMNIAKYVNTHSSLYSIYDGTDKEDFQNECKKEMAVLRNAKIGDSNTSFYDILTKSTNQLTILFKNENMLQNLRSNEYKMKFPIYASMINCHFRKAEKRKELLDQINKNCYSIFPDLPWECIQEVLSYLSDEDLKILKDTCKPL